MRAIQLTLVVVLLALGLTGCMGSTEPTADQIPKDAKQAAEDAANNSAGDEEVQTASPEALRIASNLLTPAEVEKVSGIKGLEVIKKDPRIGAGGDLNIADKNGQLILMLSIGQGDFYDISKSGENYGRDYPGLGDEAYVGPKPETFPVEYLLGVKQGDWGLVLTSFVHNGPDGKPVPFLSTEQLQELATLAMSRL